MSQGNIFTLLQMIYPRMLINSHSDDHPSEGFSFELCLFVLVGRERGVERMTRTLKVQGSDVSTFTAWINSLPGDDPGRGGRGGGGRQGVAGKERLLQTASSKPLSHLHPPSKTSLQLNCQSQNLLYFHAVLMNLWILFLMT